MLTGVILGTRKFELRKVAEPELRPGSAVVAISLCGICGSDVHAYKHGDELAYAYPPGVCGHEWAGVVEKVAPNVTDVAPGDRVVFSTPPPCGIHCAACRQGRYQACTTVVSAFFGLDGFSPESGGFAPRQRVDARRLVKIPDEISDIQGAMAEPAAVAAHAVRQSGLMGGDRAMIVGAGPIGLFALQFAKAGGAQDIIVVEPSHEKRNLALALGASHVCAPGDEASQCVGDISGGLGFDHVFECAGTPTTLQAATTYARQRGKVTLLGITGRPASLETDNWLIKEISIQTSLGFDKSDTQGVLGMMQAGEINADLMHSSTIGLDALETTLTELSSGSSAIKILVDPRTS